MKAFLGVLALILAATVHGLELGPGPSSVDASYVAGMDASFDDVTAKTLTSTGTAPSLTATGGVFTASVTAAVTQIGGAASVSGRAYQATDYLRVVSGGTTGTDRATIRWSGGGYDSTPSAPNADSNGDKMVFYNDGTGKVAQGIGSTYNMWFQSNGHASSGFRWWTSAGTTPLNQMSLIADGSLGIGATSPGAKLNTQLSASDQYLVKHTSGDATTDMFALDKFGHFSSSAAVNASLGTCTNGTLVQPSNDRAGKVTFSGANSSCALTFANAYPTAGNTVCTFGAKMATPAAYSATVTNTGFTYVTTSFANTDELYYICEFVGM